MRHLRLTATYLAMAAIAAACSSPGASSGGASQAASSEGAGASQSAASTGGGGGGGGGGGSGPNGSVTYEITGEFEASGELPFIAGGVSLWVESAGGWVANFADTSNSESPLILINTQAAEGTTGQIFSYGDGKVLLAATSDPGSGFNCTFTLTKNDESGLVGDVECSSAIVVDNNTGAQKKVHITAHWDAHP